MTLYGNTPSDLVSNSGGSEQLLIASNYAVCSTVECKEVFVQGAISNTHPITMSFSSAVSSSKGIAIAIPLISNWNFSYIRVPVSNLNLLHFWGGHDNDGVILEYRR